MSDIVEPNWISVTTLGQAKYEEELDVNSQPSKFRWRERRFTGQPIDEWKDGRAPIAEEAKSPHHAP